MTDTSQFKVDLIYPQQLEGEEWRLVEGWSRFAVSNRGRVCRLGREPSKWYKEAGVLWIYPRILIPDGRSVGLQQEGRRRALSVAALVLTAFVEPRPTPKHEARHLDDNFYNNELPNLAWGTRSDNMHDAVRNGKHGAKKAGNTMRGRRRPLDVVDRIVAGRNANGGWKSGWKHTPAAKEKISAAGFRRWADRKTPNTQEGV